MITVTQYKGLQVSKRNVVIQDSMVEQGIEQLRTQNADEIYIDDRMTQTGDIAVIDFTGYVDGEKFDGGAAERYELELGSNTFIPGFEEQVMGHLCGEEFDVNVTFPANYGADGLAGKDAVFKIVLHEIKVKRIPDLTDEFAQGFGLPDVESLRKEVKRQQEIQAGQGAEMEATNLLLAQLVRNLEGEIPEEDLEKEMDSIVGQIGAQLAQQGMTIEQYLQMTNVDMDTFRNNYKGEAEKQLKTRLALKYIADTENLQATDEEVENEYQKLSKVYNYPVEQIKADIDPEMMREDVRAQKALLFVRDNAVVTMI